MKIYKVKWENKLSNEVYESYEKAKEIAQYLMERFTDTKASVVEVS